MARKDLATPHTDPAALPQHGVVVHSWGMGGDELIVVDSDDSTIRVADNLMNKKPSDRTRKLDETKLEALMTFAFAAWHEDPTGPTPEATDIREDLIILDGDEAFYLMGHPISSLGGGTGRPAAARVMEAMYRATK